MMSSSPNKSYASPLRPIIPHASSISAMSASISSVTSQKENSPTALPISAVTSEARTNLSIGYTSSSSSIESLRCFGGSLNDGRAHPDQGPLTDRPDQGAKSFVSRLLAAADAFENSLFGDVIGGLCIVALSVMGLLILVGLTG